jgi:FkbM family methyltransferase
MDITLEQYERLNPVGHVTHAGAKMVFATPNSVTLWRVQTIHQKEPCTLDWIGAFEEGDTLLDCGANVGMYTIWAAVTRKARVFAFEPESQNYALLNRNIQLNQVSDRVTAYCMGLAERTGLSVLHMADTRAGSSCHAVGDALDYKHEPLQAAFRQGCHAARLDDLVESGQVPVPHHVKIDVDGFEPRVVAGARNTLADRQVRSVLVELNRNLADHLALVDELVAMGFRYDPAQVASAERQEGTFKGLAEHVFTR